MEVIWGSTCGKAGDMTKAEDLRPVSCALTLGEVRKLYMVLHPVCQEDQLWNGSRLTQNAKPSKKDFQSMFGTRS